MKCASKNTVIIFLLSALLVLFQNCSQTTSNTNTIVSNTRMSGNGEGYDGKIITYFRHIPGISCNSEYNEYAKIDFFGGKSTLTVNSENSCGVPAAIDSSDIIYPLNTKDYLGYKEGVYKVLNQVSNRSTSFVEAWCRPTSAEMKGLEFFVEMESETKQSWGLVFDPLGESGGWASTNGTQVNFKRSMSTHKVNYFSENFRVEISPLHRIERNAYEYKGFVSGLRNGKYVKLDLACRLGGQFDPMAPKFNYSRSSDLFSIGQSIEPLIARINKNPESFKVSNSKLPGGLSLNEVTGEIFGTPTGIESIKTVTIAAKYKSGIVTTAVSFGVGHEIQVSNQPLVGDGEDLSRCSVKPCSLKSAMQLVNGSDTPYILVLPEAEFSLDGEPLVVSGEVKILGAGPSSTIINAHGKSRGVYANKESYLMLEGLSLINGYTVGSGAGVFAEEAYLNINNVLFDGHFANTESYGQGGAVYSSKGQLYIINSLFKNNKTSLSGGGPGGGAVASLSNSETAILDSEFIMNESVSGAGLLVSHGDTWIQNVKFVENKASYQGAGVFIEYGELTLLNSEFSGNTAWRYGAGVSVSKIYDGFIYQTQFKNNASGEGASIYYESMGRDYSNFSFMIMDVDVFYDDTNAPSYSRPQSHIAAQMFSEKILLGQSVFNINNFGESCKVWVATVDGVPNTKVNSVISIGGNSIEDDSCGY